MITWLFPLWNPWFYWEKGSELIQKFNVILKEIAKVFQKRITSLEENTCYFYILTYSQIPWAFLLTTWHIKKSTMWKAVRAYEHGRIQAEPKI